MTSTASGPDGASYGYIHRPVIEEGKRQPHMTVVGGEDRFWLGPEGGPYALYFAPGTAFDTEHWQVPDAIDWGGWPVAKQTAGEVSFSRPMSLTNYAGFEVRPPRRSHGAAADPRGCDAASGSRPWRRRRRRLRVRQCHHQHRHCRMEPELGSCVHLDSRHAASRAADHGGRAVSPRVPSRRSDRSSTTRILARSHLTACAWGRRRCSSVATARAAARSGWQGRASATSPELRPGPSSADSRAVHAARRPEWLRELDVGACRIDPYRGDVINSYNDGPLGPGQPPLGPFYEIESSSPAAALAPGSSMRHVHRTVHLQGSGAALDAMSKAVLGVSLDDIATSLP